MSRTTQPEQTDSFRRLRTSIAALTRWVALSDAERSEATKPARQAFNLKLIQKIDPDGKMSDAELARRVRQARTLHFKKLALKRWGKVKGSR